MNDTGSNHKPSSHAALKNVVLMMGLVKKLQTRPPHLPNLGVMFGFSGYGKTEAAIFAQNKTTAVRVEVCDSWTRKAFLEAILIELGVAVPRGTVATMARRAVELLGESVNRPLLIDEADKLVDKGFVELVRELADFSQVPVVLIGEEALPSKLAKVERVHNRVLDWIPAQPCDLEDTKKLAALYVPKLTLSERLLDRVRDESDGRARRIVTNLHGIGEWARNHGAQVVDESYDGAFYTGLAPLQRRDSQRVAATVARRAA